MHLQPDPPVPSRHGLQRARITEMLERKCEWEGTKEEPQPHMSQGCSLCVRGPSANTSHTRLYLSYDTAGYFWDSPRRITIPEFDEYLASFLWMSAETRIFEDKPRNATSLVNCTVSKPPGQPPNVLMCQHELSVLDVSGTCQDALCTPWCSRCCRRARGQSNLLTPGR